MELSSVKFNFNCPKIIFGRNKIEELGREALNCIKAKDKEDATILLITGRVSLEKSGALKRIKDILDETNIPFQVYNEVGVEPTTSIVDTGKDIALKEKCRIIVGIGGGSVMDTAKAIAGLVTNGGTVEEYLAGKIFKKKSLPFILVPTTSGTGSEVTNNSVIKNHNTGEKKSIRGLWATLALLDPVLTLSLPKKYTAYSGADALVQAIEALVSKSRNYISDFFSRESIRILGEYLPKTCDDLSNIEFRENMMLGSLLGAISFANGKLGAVHGFAHPIGIKHGLPHGLICGMLLPHVMKYNIELSDVVDKYAWIAREFHKKQILFDHGKCKRDLPLNKKKKAKWVIEKIEDIFHHIGIPKRLSEVGIKEEHLNDIVKDTKGSSLANNPRDTDIKSLKGILLGAL
ncbi:MAG: iron-containing alcohol dehydrogenase family protein [Promethearchaeota archaeon]